MKLANGRRAVLFAGAALAAAAVSGSAAAPSAPSATGSAQVTQAPPYLNYKGTDRLGRPFLTHAGNSPDADAGATNYVRALQPRAMATRQAVLQRQALTGTGDVAGSGGTWAPYGTGSLLDNVKDYTPIDSIPTMSGRVQGFAYDPADHNHVWIAVGSGGIWETRDLGSTWRPVSDGVPTQMAGAVAYTPAGGGSLIDGTGDSGFGYLGLGIYRSTDDGATWQHAAGVPDQIATWQLVVDPTNSSRIYAATTKGLYRSDDAGATWTNLALPTGPTFSGGPECGTHVLDPTCFFNNYVTAVIVRPADKDGTKGGKVLAAVGWFRGSHHLTVKGWDQAPGNGLYESDSGNAGTFTRISTVQCPSPTGYTCQSHIGTTSLAVAEGPDQNHDVVWSMVSDAQKVDGNPPLVDPVPGVPSDLGLVYPSTLDGIYMSSDFGQTWTKKVDSNTLASCTTGTDLCGVIASPVVSGYAPGVQSWYNNWIKIDPTVQNSSGVPSRLTFGIEEVWEIPSADLPGPSNPKVIGRYFGDPFCPYTVLPVVPVNGPACPPGVPQQPTPTTTHPDQHSGFFVPDGKGGVTLFAGNDGGLFLQHIASGADFDNQHWGNGANNGLHTLLPYMAVMAKDGVAWAGLQDNGEDKVTADGRQVETFGGDGTYSAVDVNNSNWVYESYVGGNMSASTDGGHTWTNINPGLTAGQFVTPFAMDPADHNHVVIGGQQVHETIYGPQTTTPQQYGAPSNTASTDWAQVYDFGSGNSLSAVDVVGEHVYAAYCGACYLASTLATPVQGGIATNVGGSVPAQKMTSNGWHQPKMTGLPRFNYITHITMDPGNPRIVYVTTGDDSVVSYRPEGWGGEDLSKVSGRHVWKSTDAGDTFHDISGNLPDAFTNWITIHGDQLLVASNVGAYISKDLEGTSWAAMGGADLPTAPVMSVVNDPGHDNRVLAATYGRGLYLYTFPAATTGAVAQPLPNTAAQGSGMPLGLLLLAIVVAGLGAAGRRRQDSPCGRRNPLAY